MDMTASPWSRVISFEGINNFRDYGGWRAADGAEVARGVLFRSAHMARATSADLDQLAKLGLVIVTDLRQGEEQAEHPGAWIGKLPLEVIEEPGRTAICADGAPKAPHLAAFRKSDFSPHAMRRLLGGHYMTMAYDARHIELFRRYFHRLPSLKGGMVMHCAAGKDRTGILARLTHHVLGVHQDDAMEDYLLSNTAGNITQRLPALQQHMEAAYGRSIGSEAIQALLTVEPAYIKACWAALEARSGSVDAYLSNVLGVDAARQFAIRERLLS